MKGKYPGTNLHTVVRRRQDSVVLDVRGECVWVLIDTQTHISAHVFVTAWLLYAHMNTTE